MKSRLLWQEKILALFLFLLFFIPPLVFIPGFIKGHCIFVSYREPKLAALQILAWLFITVFTIFGLGRFKEELKAGLKNKVFWLLTALASYSLLSSLWAIVPYASYYEAAQWATMTILFLIFLAMFQHERWRHIALWSLWLSFGLVAVIGLIQLFVYMPWLKPVRGACKITSTFGAKNTCFVSLASQYFLLLYAIYYGIKKQKRLWWITGAALFLMETVYIFLSLSRTTYVGVAVGFCCLFLLLLLKQWREKRWISLLAVSFAVGAVILIATGLFSYGTPDPSRNIVVNGGFEELTAPGTPKGWKFYESVPKDKKKNNPQHSHKVTKDAHGGRHALMLANETGSRIGWRGEKVGFSGPDKNTFIFGGWAKILQKDDMGRYSVWARVVFEDGKKRGVELSWQQATAGKWKHVKRLYSFKKPIKTIQPYVFLYDGKGSVIFDDILIVPIKRPMFYDLINFWKNRLKPYLNPAEYLENTARGAAILDTFDMVKANPFGVGAGNWGFAYPLYHKKMPGKVFSKSIQIRRAHNSYAEYLGELGYPGAVILIGIILLSLKEIGHVLKYGKSGIRIEYMFIATTFIAILIMMSATFYLEYPYRKFLFVFIVALCTTFSHKYLKSAAPHA